MSVKQELILGVIIGIVLAFVLAIIVFFKTNPEGMLIKEYFNIFVNGQILVPVLTISLLANFALFFVLLRFNKDNISRGIMIATMVVGLFIIILKFLI